MTEGTGMEPHGRTNGAAKPFWTLESLERYLSDKIDGLEKLFMAESRAAKEAVSIAMTAAEKAAQKAENAAHDRAESVTGRLDKIENTLSGIGGVSKGVGATTAVIVQIISSLASIGAIIGVVMVLMGHK
jgi:hypothetical protein